LIMLVGLKEADGLHEKVAACSQQNCDLPSWQSLV
jgi:hypothetical protein